VRLSGLAALLAGVLLIISELLSSLPPGFFPIRISGGELAIYGWLGIEGYLGVLLAVLVQLGLVGLYASQARAAGLLGLVAILMAFIGARLIILNSFVTPFARPSVWTSEGFTLEEFWGPVAIFALSFVLGWVLFGVAALRALPTSDCGAPHSRRADPPSPATSWRYSFWWGPGLDRLCSVCGQR
jgi:hypothetical protein